MLFINSITDTIVTLISQSISISVFDLLESMAGCSHVETINVRNQRAQKAVNGFLGVCVIKV